MLKSLSVVDIFLSILQEFRNIFLKEHLRKAAAATCTWFHVITLHSSSHQRCSIKIAIDIRKKTPVLESLFNKVAGLKPYNCTKRGSNQVLSCEYCEIFENTYSEKHLQTAGSVHFKIKRRIQHPFKHLRCFFK